MVKLRLLNTVAPAYFFMATVVTFILHFCLFIPTIFPRVDTSLRSSTTLHTVVFLFLMFNALGNYIMTIKYPAESANDTVVPVCSPYCSDKVDSHYLLNGRHFCKLCKKVILKRDRSPLLLHWKLHRQQKHALLHHVLYLHIMYVSVLLGSWCGLFNSGVLNLL